MPSKKKAAKKKVNSLPIESTNEKAVEPTKPILTAKQDEPKKEEAKEPSIPHATINLLPKTDSDKIALRTLRFQSDASQQKSTSEMKQVHR